MHLHHLAAIGSRSARSRPAGAAALSQNWLLRSSLAHSRMATQKPEARRCQGWPKATPKGFSLDSTGARTGLGFAAAGRVLFFCFLIGAQLPLF
jgi:hypothetical protein